MKIDIISIKSSIEVRSFCNDTDTYTRNCKDTRTDSCRSPHVAFKTYASVSAFFV